MKEFEELEKILTKLLCSEFPQLKGQFEVKLKKSEITYFLKPCKINGKPHKGFCTEKECYKYCQLINVIPSNSPCSKNGILWPPATIHIKKQPKNKMSQNDPTEETACAYCNLIATEEQPCFIDKDTNLPVHEKCREDWMKLSGLAKQVKFRIYKLGQDESWSPGYYQGLSDAEAEVLETIKLMSEEFWNIEQQAAKKAREDIKKRQSGGLPFPELFRRYSITLFIQFGNKWFGCGKFEDKI